MHNGRALYRHHPREEILPSRRAAGSAFVKRSLTDGEYGILMAGPNRGTPPVPFMHMERLKNEVAAIAYVRKNAQSIPLPKIRCAFEDNGRFYIVTDIVPRVAMATLSSEQKDVVMKEVEVHLSTLRSLTTNIIGGLTPNAYLPFRLLRAVPRDKPIKFKEASTNQFVFCHGDLSQHNILVDEETLKITAIIDWEHAGFYPKDFERAFYKRPGGSISLEGEADDVPTLLKVLDS